jgi:hypothetical protein
MIGAGGVNMATDSWIGANSGSSNLWLNATQWSTGIPISSSDAVIGKAGTYSVVITAGDRPNQVRSLNLACVSGTVRLVDDGSLSVTGLANLTHSIFDVGATGTGSILRGFTLDGSSTVMAEGVLNVGGALQGKAGSTVIIDGGSIFAGSVTGSGKYTISLDGRLEVGGNITSTTSITFADSGVQHAAARRRRDQAGCVGQRLRRRQPDRHRRAAVPGRLHDQLQRHDSHNSGRRRAGLHLLAHQQSRCIHALQ